MSDDEPDFQAKTGPGSVDIIGIILRSGPEMPNDVLDMLSDMLSYNVIWYLKSSVS
jgi:hypothetical protein